MTFYSLEPPDSRRGPFTYGDPSWESRFHPVGGTPTKVKFESIICPVSSGHRRGGARIGDLDVILPSPKTPDFLWTWLSDCIITGRVPDLLRQEGLTGFDVRPVSVSRVKRVPKGSEVEIPPLWELVVTGSGGDAAPESGIRLIYECAACGLKEYSSFRNGIIVDEGRWDGSDFFTVNGYPKFILVTERVKEVVMENSLTNVALVESSKLQWLGLYRAEDYIHEEYSEDQGSRRD